MLNIADSWKRSQRYIQNWKPITLFTSRSGWLLVFFMKDWLVCRHSPASRAVVIMCKRDANWEWKTITLIIKVASFEMSGCSVKSYQPTTVKSSWREWSPLSDFARIFHSFTAAQVGRQLHIFCASYRERASSRLPLQGWCSSHSGKKYFLQWLTGGHQLVCRQVWLMGQNFVGIHQKLIYKIFKKH